DAATALTRPRAPPAHVLQIVRQTPDALTDAPAIGLELRLARPSRADAAAETRQRRGGPHEPRQEVLQLCQLHLQLAFARPCPLREDIEDELRSVDDA